MALPLATTTITIERSDQDGTKDAYDGVSFASIATGIRAVIGSPSGTETAQAGSSEQVGARLNADPCDLRHDDRVTDETTGEVWLVTWTRRRYGLGLDHQVADLLAVTDRVSA
jgi:hypothetical protein